MPKEFSPEELASLAVLPMGITEELLKESELVRLSLAELDQSLGAPHRHEVLTVPERGFKARVVTKSPWYLIVLSH